MTERGRRGWLLLTLVALNAALFLPAFLTAPGETDALPFTPREHPHGAFAFNLVSAVEYVKALVVRRPNADVFRVSLEFLALLLLTARWRRARVFAAVLYVTLLVFLGYHAAYAHIWRAEPALWDDLRLLPSLLGYLSYAMGRTGATLAVVGGLAVVGLLGWGAARAFGAWQRAVTPRALRVVGVLVLLCLASLAWFGVRRDDPVWQLPSKVAVDNLRASRRSWQRVAELRALRVDGRYRGALDARLTRKPRVYLLMIEAYGQRLVADPELREPFRHLATRVDERLAAMGYSTRSAFSASPVYGGKSWLSVATVQTGARIDTPSLYDEVVQGGTRLATVTAFFKAQGYRTSALVPGNYRTDLGPDPYGRDVVLDQAALGYSGPHSGYVGVPDQFSLRAYRSRVLSQDAQPHFAFFLSISTHRPFPELSFEGGAAWPAIDGADRIGPPTHAAYFHSVEYEWRALLEFIEGEASDDAVFLLVGDHQPMLDGTTARDRETARLQQSSLTPVHVLSRNRAFVERFAAYGFTPGLFPEPGAVKLKHEGLQSLLIHELVGEYGSPDAQRFTRYDPDGIGLVAP